MPVSYGFLSTYPSTECGLATFTAALLTELRDGSPVSRVGVVRVVDRPRRSSRPEVVHHLVTGSPGGEAEAAAVLNDFDVAIVQHEYGIYGGPDGDQILGILDQLTVPVIVVLHTVLVTPTQHQREVLERVVAMADAVVTMTPTARRRLFEGYKVDRSRVSLIPHGARDNRSTEPPLSVDDRPTILTWGLLGPGKGVEWVIDALAELRDLDPKPRYLVVGETHPKVLQREGEAYRRSLVARAASAGVADLVEFEASYLDLTTLNRIVAGADVVILPYDSKEQVTSGVLVEALAAGKPVIATGFPHAVELLGEGTGLVVPQRNPQAMGHALRRVLTDPALAARMGADAAALAPQLFWPAVAGRYEDLAAGVLLDNRASAVA